MLKCNYRVKFHMISCDTGKKTFMASDILKVKYEGEHDKERECIHNLNNYAGMLRVKHMPRFRPQLFTAYEV